ncbi:MAG: beta-ketoacyl-[acyl-carrier-protein] synthase family protein [Smithellaceae bacterium]|nr:beta-ketoacyl-[acyl-carrier-protein] synthase family protein [Syntrophaceae bacterium]MBP8607868.1 beta-ketoacyl-[acyl-carrier-protein] synthase family protein [Syntrophaceae bacterium]NMD04359.1 beta-ketoacyl-[acyl-carrier-protein] synthase family protein [Deltaproteobacteria bacterium]
MNRKKRIVVTGLGSLNALAKNIPDLIKALRDGVCGIGPLDLFDTSNFRTKNGGQIKDFVPRDYIPGQYSLKRMSRADQLSFAATLEALRDAGLYPVSAELKEETGVVIGGGSGGLFEAENFYGDLLKKGSSRSRFSTLSSVYCASSADRIASALGLTGPKTTFMTACSAGGTAIGYARDLIVNDNASVMLAGGVEPMCRITYAAFNALQSVDPDVCRPFDRNRVGLSLGEAAAMMVLEPLDEALARRAKIYAEILGYGISCDSFHMTAPDEQASGAVRSMQAALKDAGLSLDDIDYINAHGTATPVNDVMETKAIKEVFGKRAYKIPVSSTKSMHAHTLGAAGALEGIVSVLALQNGFVPPTINYSNRDPLCDLDYVTEGMRKTNLRTVLSNSFAFGGNNTTVVFGKYSEKGARNG